jgi:hypothetical protein
VDPKQEFYLARRVRRDEVGAYIVSTVRLGNVQPEVWCELYETLVTGRVIGIRISRDTEVWIGL